MIKPIFLSFFLLISYSANAQSYYYPPSIAAWETLPPGSLSWNSDSLDGLQQFLEENNTKAFLILKEGRIVVEWYYDNFTQDSLWYWASAGKTMTASLIGVAQAEGLLDIQDPSSQYLGQGWTSCDSSEEAAMTIWHQLTMTTAMDDTEFDCITDSCLACIAPAGNRWSYHNGPYTLLTDVIEAATGGNINQYLNSRVLMPIGGLGSYIQLGNNRLLLSTPRTMARFGHLILSKGNWNGNQVIESTWVHDMTTPSQSLNPSYGYLWWLNGQGSYMLPGAQFQFPGNLIPTAPADLSAGLGKNDQKVYVVPSQDLVVVRMGNAAEGGNFALSSFDEDLWAKISNLDQSSTAIIEALPLVKVFPVPASDQIRIESEVPVSSWRLYAMEGKLIIEGKGSVIPLEEIGSGIYFAHIQLLNGVVIKQKVIRE